MNEHKKNKTSGITIISLVVTVIVLLILAGISMMMLSGDNGIILNAGKAKESAGLAQEAEKIQSAILKTSSKTKFGDITIEGLQGELDKEFGENQTEAIDNGETIVVKIEERYYEIDENGNLSEPITLEKIEYAGDITKGGTCTGTEANPYRIECIEDLVKLSQMAYNNQTIDTNKYYLLVKDLDFNSIFSYSNYKAKYKYDEEKKAYIPDESSEITIKELCTSGMGFIPIAQSYGSDGKSKTFRGTFYGKEQRKIKNIYMNRGGSAGLFCGCSNAKIRNITVDGDIISTGSLAAGICGSGWSNTIENCINKAKIVSKTSDASGIQASGGNGNIINCINYGEIISERSNASGISNYLITLNKCRNFGTVTGSTASGISISRYGGDTGIMRNCLNAGTIISSGTGSTSGLLKSNNEKNKVYNSYNIGTLKNEVSSQPSIYGICGNSTTGKYAQNCYFAGTITTKDGANKSNCSMVTKCDEQSTNCFYLEDSMTKSGIVPEISSISFVKTATDENVLTSQKVVDSFNEYIENPSEGINTSTWLRWRVGENGLPELIFEKIDN